MFDINGCSTETIYDVEKTYKCKWCQRKDRDRDIIVECWTSHYDIWSQVHVIPDDTSVIVKRATGDNFPLSRYNRGRICKSKDTYSELLYLVQYNDESRHWEKWINVVPWKEVLNIYNNEGRWNFLVASLYQSRYHLLLKIM